MHLVTVLATALRFLQGMVYFYLALILRERGFSGLQIGALLSLYTFTPLLLSFPAGILNDRFPSKGLLALALLGNAAFYGLLTRTSSFPMLLLLFVVGGASINLANISLQSTALKTTGGERRSTRLGIFQGGNFLGFAGGLLTGACILYGNPPSFLLATAAAASLALIALALAMHTTAKVHIHPLEYLAAFNDRRVLLFCLTYSIFAFHWGSEGSSYGLFLQDWFRLTKFESGLFMGLPILALGLAAIFTGPLLDRHGGSLRSLTVIAFLCSGLGQILMVVPWLPVSFALRIVHEAGDGIAGTLLLTEMANRFAVSRIGGLSSLVTLCTITAQSLGLLVFSRVGELYGHHVAIAAGGFAALAPLVLLGWTRKERW